MAGLKLLTAAMRATSQNLRNPVRLAVNSSARLPIIRQQQRLFSATTGTSFVTLDESATPLKSFLSKPDSRVIAYFTATWCGPCRAIAPVFSELASKNADVTFVKIDIDSNSATTEMAGIQSVPTFQAFRNGSLIKTFTGARKDALTDLVTSLKAAQ